MDADPQILKGLVLLLEDMSLTVISVNNQSELEATISTANYHPDLLVLPLDFDKDITGIQLVEQIRRSCDKNIPAILYSQEDCISSWQYERDDDWIICCELNPRQLRQHINALMDIT